MWPVELGLEFLSEDSVHKNFFLTYNDKFRTHHFCEENVIRDTEFLLGDSRIGVNKLDAVIKADNSVRLGAVLNIV